MTEDDERPVLLLGIGLGPAQLVGRHRSMGPAQPRRGVLVLQSQVEAQDPEARRVRGLHGGGHGLLQVVLGVAWPVRNQGHLDGTVPAVDQPRALVNPEAIGQDPHGHHGVVPGGVGHLVMVAHQQVGDHLVGGADRIGHLRHLLG